MRYFRCILVVFCLFGSAIVTANDRRELAYTVICEDQALTKQLESGISERLAKAHVTVTDKAPSAHLFLYVMRDVSSNINKNGLTIAIAHVSKIPVLDLAVETIKVKKEKPSPLLVNMLHEEGFIHHLSAAHLDEGTPQQVNILLDSVVETFIQKSL